VAKMLITFYSRSGHTQAMAGYIAEGAREVEDIEVTVLPVADVTPDDLLEYDAIVMGSPVYYGTMAAELKQLIDDSVKHHRKLDGKVGGGFASAGGVGGGNETTVLDIVKALMIHGMVVKGEPMGDHYGPVAIGAPDDRSQRECRKYGKMVAELAVRLFG